MRYARRHGIGRTGISTALAGAGLVIGLAACAGPSPVADAQTLNGTTVQDSSGGAVSVEVRIADATGRQIAQAEGVALDSEYGAYLASRYAESQSDFAAAATLLDRVLQDNPDDPRLVQRTFVANINAGRFDRALELAQRIDPNGPNAIGLATLTQAADALRRGAYEEAIDFIEATERTSLARFAAPIFGAWAFAGDGQNDAAMGAINEIGGEGGFANLSALHAGLIQLRAGQPKAAMESLAPEIAAIEGDSAEAIASRAAATARLPARVLRAYARARLAAGDEGGDVVAMLNAFQNANPGQTFIAQDISALEADGALDPLLVDPAAGAADGLYYLASGVQRQAEALSLAYGRLATYLDPTMELSRLLVAEILESRGRYQEAIAELEEIPEGSEFSWSARLGAVDSLIQLDRDAEAAAALERMAAERPDDIEALMKLGYLMRLRERFGEGASVYDRVLERLSEDGDQNWLVHYYRGITLERTDRWPEAEDSFLKALDLKPDDPYVLNYLGYSWVDKGMNIERAQKMIRQAVDQRQNDGYIVDSLGWVQYKLGQYPQAVRHLERAVQLRPQDPVINDHLGDAYWQVGREREARFQWERVLSLDPDAELIEAVNEKLESGLKPDPDPEPAAQ